MELQSQYSDRSQPPEARACKHTRATPASQKRTRRKEAITVESRSDFAGFPAAAAGQAPLLARVQWELKSRCSYARIDQYCLVLQCLNRVLSPCQPAKPSPLQPFARRP